MRNADMPAMPGNTDPQTASYMDEFSDGVGIAQLGYWNSGIRKREYFAAMAMQGLLASGHFEDGRHRIEDVTNEAINHADAILAELERTS